MFFQMLDMIMPKKLNVISLQDLRRCRMTPIFFDTFFNLEKYLDHEQRDPFASQRDVDEDGNEVIFLNLLNIISTLLYNLFIEQFLMHPFSMFASLRLTPVSNISL